MNDLQKTEFELLRQLVAVCDKLNIKYFVLCGSTLGAVKYQGFIPWDDDIDVGMFRKDYERFLQSAPKLLPKNTFLQSYKTDKNYFNIFAKLRNSSTAYIEKTYSKIDINHGVYIDVFPLDGYPAEKSEQKKLERQKLFYKQRLSSWYDNPSLIKKLLKMPLRFITPNPQKTAAKYEKLISSYSTDDSAIICNHGNWQGRLEYAPKEQYGDGTTAEFEGLAVRVPEKADEYLTQKYGDWRAELPKDEQVGHHFYEVCDLNRPYTDYIEKLPNGKIKVKH